MATSEYRRAYYDKRKAKYIAYLGGNCARCDATDGLQFDHIDRKTKSFTITDRLDWSWDKVKPELDKCQLLCDPCHIKKSIEAGDLPPRAVHGTHAMYRHHGCRCADCRRANTEVNRKYKKPKGQHRLVIDHRLGTTGAGV